MTSKFKPLRVGLIGAGMISAYHLQAWAALDGVTVVAIADPAIDRARARAREFGIANIYETAEALISNEQPDALDIASPVATHASVCRLAADQGVHIFCQKPLTPSLSETEILIKDINDRVRFMVHENWRFRPTYRHIKAWLDEGRIGPVQRVHMSVQSSGLVEGSDGTFPALERQPFLANLERLLVFEVLGHHIDTLAWLFGPMAATSAKLSRRSHAVVGEDTASIVFAGKDGLAVSIDASLCEFSAPLHVQDRLEVIGTKGRVHLVDGQVSLHGEALETASWPFDTVYSASFLGSIREFRDAMSSGRSFETEASKYLAVNAAIDRIYEMSAWTSSNGRPLPSRP